MTCGVFFAANTSAAVGAPYLPSDPSQIASPNGPRPADDGGLRRSRFGPQHLLLVLIALAPYHGLLLIAGLPRIVDAWKEGMVALALGLAVLEQPSRRHRKIPMWMVPLVLLILWSIGSALRHPGFQSVLGLKINYAYVLVPVVLILSPLNAHHRDRLISILMVNGAITSAIGIIQQGLGGDRLHAMGYEWNEVIRSSNGMLRSFSTFNQPFPFALFVMVVLLVTVPICLEDRRRLRNRIFLWLTPLLVIGMATAVVRAAFLGLAVGVLYLAVTRYRVLGHLAMALPVLIAVLIATGSTAAMLSSSSLQERIAGWVSEVDPQTLSVTGQGIGTTGATAERIEAQTAAGATWRTGHEPQRYQADNQYVKTLIELGPIGLWLFCWVIALGARSAHRAAHDGFGSIDPHDRALAAGIAAASLAAIVSGLVATYWEIFPVDLLFWFLLGVVPSLRPPSS